MSTLPVRVLRKAIVRVGTLSTKCNTQMVVPHLTENYGASRDHSREVCAHVHIAFVPTQHRSLLNLGTIGIRGLFEKCPAEANAYLSKPMNTNQTRVRTRTRACAKTSRKFSQCLIHTLDATTFQECINWARLRFQDYFHDRVVQLTFTFPEDAVTSTGNAFLVRAETISETSDLLRERRRATSICSKRWRF